MKIIEGFKLRKVAGEMIISGEGLNQLNFNKLVSLNTSAAYLWNSVEGVDFDIETIAQLLVKKYEIDMELALKDAKTITDAWYENGLIEK